MPTSPRSRDGRLRTARGWRPPFALNTEQAHVMHVRLAAWKELLAQRALAQAVRL